MTIILAFDLYETILSTASITDKLVEVLGGDDQGKAQGITTAWRRYQTQYTWRLNSMEEYRPFSDIVRLSLHHALDESSTGLSQEDIDSLIHAFDALSTFPDVKPALDAWTENPPSDVYPVIFSNGTQSMVSNAVHNSPDLSPNSGFFKKIVVVDGVKRYKPHPEVYRYLARELGNEMGDLWLVSGNPFDVVGARKMGMQAVWIDRGGKGWVDRLIDGEQGRPTVIVKELREVVDAVMRHRAKQ